MAPWWPRAMDILTLPSRLLARGMVLWTVEVVLPRPRAVIAACVALVLLCAAGVHRLELATATDQLWVPQDTAVMHNRERVRALFGSQPQWQSVIVTPEGGGSDDDALAASIVDALFALEAKIEAIPGWQDACYRLRAISRASGAASRRCGATTTRSRRRCSVLATTPSPEKTPCSRA